MDKALPHYVEALRIKPNNIKALNDMGVALGRAGRWREAKGCLRKIILIQPGNVKARHNLGVILTREGELQEALKQFQEVLKLNPDDVKARDQLKLLMKKLNSGDFSSNSKQNIQVNE
ncbi:MAG: tetratricopeptide repeat protein [Deltaproteobacteria bacterium]|nr:tetratricopeptide repeat protein [Deltaproteobacteria bacterium]